MEGEVAYLYILVQCNEYGARGGWPGNEEVSAVSECPLR